MLGKVVSKHRALTEQYIRTCRLRLSRGARNPGKAVTLASEEVQKVENGEHGPPQTQIS